jgi:hypothetical protein
MGKPCVLFLSLFYSFALVPVPRHQLISSSTHERSTHERSGVKGMAANKFRDIPGGGRATFPAEAGEDVTFNLTLKIFD